MEKKIIYVIITYYQTGPHYISLSWNQTLAIQAVDRVALRWEYEKRLELPEGTIGTLRGADPQKVLIMITGVIQECE